MQSNGKVIAVIGARGKLAPFVIGALGQAGYKVVTDIQPVRNLPVDTDLTHPGEAGWLADRWRDVPIDGLIALTGRYAPVNLEDPYRFDSVFRDNVLPVVNVVSVLLPELRKNRGVVVAVDAMPVPQWNGAPHGEGAYRAGKAALDAYLRQLSTEEPSLYVELVQPDRPIDSDEERSKAADFIVSVVKQATLNPASWTAAPADERTDA